MDPSSKPVEPLCIWAKFISRYINTRSDASRFETLVPALASRYPLPPPAIADLLLRPSFSNHFTPDPRIFPCLQCLFQLGFVNFAAIFTALYRYTALHRLIKEAGATALIEISREDRNALHWQNAYSFEEVTLYRLTKSAVQGTVIGSSEEAGSVLDTAIRWMRLWTAVSTALIAKLESLGAITREEMDTARAAFVLAVISVLESSAMLKALSRPSSKNIRKELSDSLDQFLPTLHNPATIPLMERLELFRTQTLAGLDPPDPADQVSQNELLDRPVWLESLAAAGAPVQYTRAGLYIYLDAALVGRPLMDDDALFNYMHNSYHGDAQTSFTALILASFDVLANAVFRKEGQKTAHLLRSYLINKLPLLLVRLSPSLYAVTPEYCISEALRMVDTNAFPTMSSMFDDTRTNTDPFTDSVREDFCFACGLHELVSQANIEATLGEHTYQTLPSDGRYTKDGLVRECLANPENALGLVAKLDKMDGNVGAVCQALTEVLRNLCEMKETQALKFLCNLLVRKPTSLDVMLLFDQPATILHPLCELLDGWRYEEDQGEYQPVYEEFGSVLLLVLTFAYRYSLTTSDLGIRNPDSFVAKLLVRGHLSRTMSDLSTEEADQVGRWLLGLFDNGSELGDDVMSACLPQDFYLLVPTIFHQVIIALSTGILAEDNLKIGVEYLVEALFLPSLVTALLFLTNRLWIDPPNRQRTDQPSEQRAIIRLLHLILLPNAISNDARSILQSVINTVAEPLVLALRAFQKREPASREVEPLLRVLRDSVPLSRRTDEADYHELESWTLGMPNGGLVTSLRHIIHGFVQWSLNPGANVMPTSYTHRQFLAALRILSARRVLDLLLSELVQRAGGPAELVMYDIAMALICAPDASDLLSRRSDPVGFVVTPPPPPPRYPQRRLSLRDALRLAFEDAPRLQRADPALAQVVVRLFRRVEAQMAVAGHHMPLLPSISGPLGLGLGADAEAMAAAVVADAMTNIDAAVVLDLSAIGQHAGGVAVVAGDSDHFALAGETGLLDGWKGLETIDLG